MCNLIDLVSNEENRSCEHGGTLRMKLHDELSHYAEVGTAPTYAVKEVGIFGVIRREHSAVCDDYSCLCIVNGTSMN